MGISDGIVTKAARFAKGFDVLQGALSAFKYRNL